MRHLNELPCPRKHAAWLLPCLLAHLAMAHAAAPAPAQAGVAAASTTYRVVNLGPGAPLTALPSINASGQVLFSLQTELGFRAFFYDGAASRDIGTLGGSVTWAFGLNNAGQVAGRATLANGVERAFMWSAQEGMRDLGVVPGAFESQAAAINNFGVVVGNSDAVPALAPHAFRWSAADGIENLGSLRNGFPDFSSATALNDAGLIAGNSDIDNSNDRHAFAWTRAQGMVDIDTLNSIYSLPVAVGAKGEVAGNFVGRASGQRYHAFIWTGADGMRDLGTAGGTESFVIAMSPQAHVTGLINLASGNQHAMSWTRSAGMVDLGTLGGMESRAFGVNNNGQIVGAATDPSGDYQAYVWTANSGLVDLNKRLRHAPAGFRIDQAYAISDCGAIVASSNAGLVLLTPDQGHNGPHAVGPIAAADRVRVGAPLGASVSFVDEDMVGTRGVNWSWGDGSGDQPGKVRASNGAGSAVASHSYAAPGIYSVRATVIDRAGASAAVSREIIAYEPSGGVVGGSGALLSPQGALAAAPTRSGKASFSFVAPLNLTAQPAGTKAQMHFDFPGLSFRSGKMTPVAVRGAGRQFEGSGTVNGAGDYKFTLGTTVGAAAGAGERGRFSLKIWHADPATRAQVVDYDNQGARSGGAGASIVEGRIFQE